MGGSIRSEWILILIHRGWQDTFWEDTDSQSKWQYHVYHVGWILISEVSGSIRSGWILISVVGVSIRSGWILIRKVNGSNMLVGYLFPKWVVVYVLGGY